ARIEDGSQTPTFFEGLIIALILGAPAMEIFPALRQNARRQLLAKLREVKTSQRTSSSPRSAYNTAQLERITATVQSRAASQFSAPRNWETKQFLDWVESYL